MNLSKFCSDSPTNGNYRSDRNGAVVVRSKARMGMSHSIQKAYRQKPVCYTIRKATRKGKPVKLTGTEVKKLNNEAYSGQFYSPHRDRFQYFVDKYC